MKVSEIIDRLSKLDQNATVLVWHSYHDEPTSNVCVEAGTHVEYTPEYYQMAWSGEGGSTVLIS